MEIKLTKKQYECLAKLVYLGNWMVNAHRLPDEMIKEYDDMEGYIFSLAKGTGLDKYIEYDEELNMFFPTVEFELESEIGEYIEDYSNSTFWEELIDRISERDLEREYGEKAVERMSPEERIKKLTPFYDKYASEFEKNGIEKIVISR